MPVALFLALKFLREGKAASTLVIAAVGVGVSVIVFLSALIGGLQRSLIEKTLGTQAHVVVRPQEERPRPQLRPAPSEGVIVASREQRPAQRVRSIVGWQRTMAELAADPEVEAVTPVVTGPGFAVRGTASKSVAVLGIDPASYVRVVTVDTRLVAGALPRSGTEVAIGSELADDLGVEVGDKLRIQAAGGRTELFTIAGVFRLGNREVDARWVLVTLRAGQTLLDLVGGVSSLELRVRALFEADRTAARMTAHTGLVAESWMQLNAELLTALRSQGASSLLIQVFVVLAVTIGITSVLVVSVVQKRREIGILRAMGATRRRIAAVFLIQGGALGMMGSIVGVATGVGVATLFRRTAVDPRGQPLFPIEVEPSLVLVAVAIALGTGLIAALLPALRASRLDPAVAIRHE
ncbi:MAG: ABC transporter permease [Nannocystaceae bacterium]|nr:ABC transporter permease [Nannocystaceae bacterium]